MTRSLPHFVGIGAQKSGTTWTWTQLRRHPDLWLPDRKELNYFYSGRPEAWYREQFTAAPPRRLCGEVSPNYFSQDGVAERMHALLPHAKLFCILREPGARAYSQWKMARSLGNIPGDVSFIEAFRANLRHMADQGDYAARIAEFAAFYPPDRMLVTFHDDLEADPAGFLSELLAWLEVDVIYDESKLDERVAASREPSLVPDEHRDEVDAYFAPTVRRLEDLTGRDLSHWSS